MKLKTIIIVFFIIPFLFSCKKEYTCECSDNVGVKANYKIRETKKKATEQCGKDVILPDIYDPSYHCYIK